MIIHGCLKGIKKIYKTLLNLSSLLNFDKFTPFVKFDLKSIGNEIYN